MKLHTSFKDCDHLEASLEAFDPSIAVPRSKSLTIKILREILLRPYLPSSELCKKFRINKEDLKSIYLYIRSSGKVRVFFRFSPFYYLTKVLEHLSRYHERTSSIIKGETPFPLSETLELFISEKCNARCKFCYRDGKTYDDTRALSTQEYVDLINEFADLHGQNLDVSGGLEPLLSPSILEVLKAGLDRNLKVSLYTNGIALNDPKIVNSLMQIHSVRVSLNAYDRKSYREVMGVDRFNRVVNNLRDLVETKRNSKSEARIGTSFVVLKDNYAHIPEAIKLAQRLGVDFLDLRLAEMTDMPRFDKRQRKELGSVLKKITQDNSCGKYGKLSVSLADTFSSIVSPSNDFLKYMNKNFVNDLVYYRVTVSPHGRVYALNLIGQPSREDQRYLLGNIGSNESLSDILSMRKAVPFESKFLLAHDISLMIALSKLESDLKFGISLEENPFIQA